MGITAYLLAAFWAMQASVALLFKFGGTAPGRWMPCFLAGNVIGVSSTWIWMLVMQKMNPNVALGLIVGGAFLAGQVAVALVFRSHLSVMQIVGIAAILAGMLCLCFGGKI
jgi:multidrug transporter EmrE-like cation transporter